MFTTKEEKEIYPVIMEVVPFNVITGPDKIIGSSCFSFFVDNFRITKTEEDLSKEKYGSLYFFNGSQPIAIVTEESKNIQKLMVSMLMNSHGNDIEIDRYSINFLEDISFLVSRRYIQPLIL